MKSINADEIRDVIRRLASTRAHTEALIRRARDRQRKVTPVLDYDAQRDLERAIDCVRGLAYDMERLREVLESEQGDQLDAELRASVVEIEGKAAE